MLKGKTLYLVTDYVIEFNELLKRVEIALIGGVDIVQYRSKGASTRVMCDEALKLKRLCNKYNALFIINDRVDVAKVVDADGVHVGQDDMKANLVRKILGDDKIIGVSARNLQEALQAKEDGADYIGVGALFTTQTKLDAKSVELDTLKEIRKVVDIPIYGIGGISLDNITEEVKENTDGVAVVSAILNAKDIEATSRKFKEILAK